MLLRRVVVETADTQCQEGKRDRGSSEMSRVGLAVEPRLREAPVMGEGSWVGLDVHARSVGVAE
jgi:hypothetical protein